MELCTGTGISFSAVGAGYAADGISDGNGRGRLYGFSGKEKAGGKALENVSGGRRTAWLCAAGISGVETFGQG